MKNFVVPMVLSIVGILVMAVSIRYYIHDSIYVRETQAKKTYLIPNTSYVILAAAWIVLAIYLAAIIFIQLSN